MYTPLYLSGFKGTQRYQLWSSGTSLLPEEKIISEVSSPWKNAIKRQLFSGICDIRLLNWNFNLRSIFIVGAECETETFSSFYESVLHLNNYFLDIVAMRYYIYSLHCIVLLYDHGSLLTAICCWPCSLHFRICYDGPDWGPVLWTEYLFWEKFFYLSHIWVDFSFSGHFISGPNLLDLYRHLQQGREKTSYHFEKPYVEPLRFRLHTEY